MHLAENYKMHMKTIKLLLLALLLGIFASPDLSAQTKSEEKSGDWTFKPGIGVGLKASTNGLGGDVIYNFHKRMAIRLGFEKLGFATNVPFEEQGIEYSADVKFQTGSVSLLYDFYVLNHVFLTAGAGYNLFRVNADGHATGPLQFGDLSIPPESIGTFNFQVDPSMKISPYMGLGFGRTLGLKHRVGFAFELGGYYQGSPAITIATTGLLGPTSNPDQGQAARLEGQINQYTIYPVLKLSLSYKILTF